MKIPQIVINILVVGAIIYILLKLKEARDNYKIQDAVNNLENPQNNGITLKALDWHKPINEKSTGSEVAAIQMMLQYYNPSQQVTGVMDDDTYFRLRSLTSGVFDGDISFYSFAYSIFNNRFPGEFEKIITRFPNS